MATRGALRSAYPLRVAARKKTKKAYRIPATQVRFVDMGGGIATDRITVDGAPVGFMRRGVPLAPEDSGWSFYAGDETKRSLADRSTSAVWHVNDVANLDPAIVPYLYALPGAAFERDAASGRFVETPESRPDPEVAGLPAGVSVVQGEVQVAEGLVVHLPTPFRSRVEDGSLVLWRPGLTFWIAAGAARGAPEIPEDARDVERREEGDVSAVVFGRAPERANGPSVVVAHLDGPGTRVFAHAYHDRPGDGFDARAILLGVRSSS